MDNFGWKDLTIISIKIDKFYKHQMLDIIDYRNLRYQGETR